MNAILPILTIKNYRSCCGNEGDAFAFTLYVDGKRSATVAYAGTGGDVAVLWVDEIAKRHTEAWIRAMPAVTVRGLELNKDLSWILGEMSDKHRRA